MQMTIFYTFDGKLYANITNKCPCDCKFCIRRGGDSIVGNDSLWLEHEPTPAEIKSAFDAYDASQIGEVVFCGYGEPMQRAQTLIDTARYIKSKGDIRIRVNTNGLVRLIDPQFDISALKGAVDSVSVSLNASDEKKYNEITRPCFGEKAYGEMLRFSQDVKAMGIEVGFTVVDMDGMEDEIAACQEVADSMGIPLRVRDYVTDNESYT